jgi:hypothetical protein
MDLNGSGPNRCRPAQTQQGAREDGFKQDDRRGQPVSGYGDRRDMGRRGPSDQVMSNGPQSSSTSGRDERGRNPSQVGISQGLT